MAALAVSGIVEDRAVPRAAGRERHARDALREARIEGLDHEGAHGQADHVSGLRSEKVHCPRDVADEVEEVQRTGRVVAVAVAAQVDGDRPPRLRQAVELGGPVGAVAADPVHEHDVGAVAGNIARKLGTPRNSNGLPCHQLTMREKRSS